MSIGRRIVLPLAILLIGSCAAGPRGAVRPAPPGPVDLIRGVFGDFSGLCPDHYEYCRGGRRSICCPESRGCCEDASGPICCANAYREEWSRDERRPPPPEEERYECAPSDITCSHEGRTTCCSRHDGCCADENGPYCCVPGESRSNYPDTY